MELSSYVSGDFLSAGVTSTATQTNSYTLRLRQAWGQAKFDNGWKFLGGQTWSLVTENKAGIAPSDDIGQSQRCPALDHRSGYNVGFTFARQYGLRLTKDFGDKVSVAFAMENAQGTLTTHDNAANFLLGEAGASNTYNTPPTTPPILRPISSPRSPSIPALGTTRVFGLARPLHRPCLPVRGDTTSPRSHMPRSDRAQRRRRLQRLERRRRLWRQCPLDLRRQARRFWLAWLRWQRNRPLWRSTAFRSFDQRRRNGSSDQGLPGPGARWSGTARNSTSTLRGRGVRRPEYASILPLGNSGRASTSATERRLSPTTVATPKPSRSPARHRRIQSRPLAPIALPTRAQSSRVRRGSGTASTAGPRAGSSSVRSTPT